MSTRAVRPRASSTRATSILAAIILVAILYVAFGRARTVPLVALPTPLPAGPIEAPPDMPMWSLTVPTEHELMNEAERRRKRNRVVEDWRSAIEAQKRGEISERNVEQIAMQVLHWRHIAGELDDESYHTQLAAYLDREVKRLESLFSMRTTSEEHLERTRLYALREHVLGGNDDGSYSAARKKYFEALADRHKALSSLGRGRSEYYRNEYERLQETFPPVESLRPKK